MLEGQDIASVPCAKRARLGIGYSPEGRRVFNSLTVTENILSGSARHSQGRGDEKPRLADVGVSVAGGAGEPARQPDERRPAANRRDRAGGSTMPKLLLLDEPFLGLAPVWIRQVGDMVRELKARGTTILMTEQMAQPALKLVDRAYVMRGGEIRRSGTVAEIRDEALAEEYL